MPGRKKKCEHCGEFIYVRTHPKNRKKILIRSDQIEIIELEWAKLNGTYDQLMAEKRAVENERKRLRKKFGKEPSENDVQWGLLNSKVLNYISTQQWGLCRNAKLSMGQILLSESKYRDALPIFIEVLYLDINGPMNIDPSISKRRFDSTMGMVVPYVLGEYLSLIEKNGLPQEAAESEFVKEATKLQKNLKPRIGPEGAWKRIKKEMKHL